MRGKSYFAARSAGTAWRLPVGIDGQPLGRRPSTARHRALLTGALERTVPTSGGADRAR